MAEINVTIGQLIASIFWNVFLGIVVTLAIITIGYFIIDPSSTVEIFKDLFGEWINNWKKFLRKD